MWQWIVVSFVLGSSFGGFILFMLCANSAVERAYREGYNEGYKDGEDVERRYWMNLGVGA